MGTVQEKGVKSLSQVMRSLQGHKSKLQECIGCERQNQNCQKSKRLVGSKAMQRHGRRNWHLHFWQAGYVCPISPVLSIRTVQETGVKSLSQVMRSLQGHKSKLQECIGCERQK